MLTHLSGGHYNAPQISIDLMAFKILYIKVYGFYIAIH